VEKKFSPNSGTALYSMNIKAKLPETISMADLDDKLEDLAEMLQVEITIK